MAWGIVGLLIICCGLATYFIVYYKGKADKSDEYRKAWEDEKAARALEGQRYFLNNQAWQKEADELKSLVIDLRFKLGDRDEQLRKISEQHPAGDVAGTGGDDGS